VKKENQAQFESLVDATYIGQVTDSSVLKITCGDELVVSQPVSTLEKAWKGAIPCLLS
jgi:phosphoribosylformylglycinamidine synthase